MLNDFFRDFRNGALDSKGGHRITIARNRIHDDLCANSDSEELP